MTKRILNEKGYWNISYIKTGDIENKISRWSLNNWDGEKGLKKGSIECDLEIFEVWNFWDPGSEKGSTRKHTENRVTRWIKMFWGNLAILR
jgi:hypothetical protein